MDTQMEPRIKHDQQFSLRLTSDEKTRIRAAAQRDLMPVSVWLRRVIRRALSA